MLASWRRPENGANWEAAADYAWISARSADDDEGTTGSFDASNGNHATEPLQRRDRLLPAGVLAGRLLRQPLLPAMRLADRIPRLRWRLLPSPRLVGDGRSMCRSLGARRVRVYRATRPPAGNRGSFRRFAGRGAGPRARTGHTSASRSMVCGGAHVPRPARGPSSTDHPAAAGGRSHAQAACRGSTARPARSGARPVDAANGRPTPRQIPSRARPAARSSRRQPTGLAARSPSRHRLDVSSCPESGAGPDATGRVARAGRDIVRSPRDEPNALVLCQFVKFGREEP
jgi:hypothetical protein